VEFSAYVQTEGDARPAIGMLNFVKGKGGDLITERHQGDGSQWTRISRMYDVPDDSSVQLIVTCLVEGKSGTAWFDDVSVMPVSQPRAAIRTDRPTPSTPSPVLKATAEIDARSVIRKIPQTLYGTNVEWIWNGNLLWEEDKRRPNPELMRLTKELGVSLIRFPGGHYSDFYHWRDGIGPFEKRPQALHETGKSDRSRPNFGTDEALDFADQVNGELLITVNAGSGNAREAADWVKHVNGKSQRVRFWEVGNELYMNEGSAMSKSITVDPGTYATRFREFAQAMRAADPSIKIGAIGGENYGHYQNVNYPNWNRVVLEKIGDQIDFFAVHNAYAPVLISGDNKDVRTVYKAMLAAPQLIQRNLETIEKQIATYAPTRASKIGIAVTEWGPLFQFDPKSRFVQHGKTLGSALFVASTLKAFIDSPRTEIANFFLLNDVSVLGWIGSRNGKFPPQPDWAPNAQYYALQMYTRHFGDQLLRSDSDGPTFDSEALGLLEAVKGVPYLDIVASLNADGRELYVMAINKHFDSSIDTSITLKGFQPASNGTVWTLNGTSIDANTGTTPLKAPGLSWGKQVEDRQVPRFSQGAPGEITLSDSSFKIAGTTFSFTFPPHSLTSLVLTRAK
jgi:alpha-N-arabinofuranosidase